MDLRDAAGLDFFLCIRNNVQVLQTHFKIERKICDIGHRFN